MTSPIETIAARVLADHYLAAGWVTHRGEFQRCEAQCAAPGCGWTAPADGHQGDAHEAHVAAEIARAIAEDQGALATVARVVRGWDHTDEPLDQYYFAAHELIDALTTNREEEQ